MINPQLVAVLPKTESLDSLGDGISAELGEQLQAIDNNSFNFDEALLAEIRSAIASLEIESTGEDSQIALELPEGKELPLLPEAMELAEEESVVLAGTMVNITKQTESENLSVGTVLIADGRNPVSSPVLEESDMTTGRVEIDTGVKTQHEDKITTSVKPLLSSAAEELLLKAESRSPKPLEVLNPGGTQIVADKTTEPGQAPAIPASIKLSSTAAQSNPQATQKLSIGMPVQHAKWADNLAGRVSYMLANSQQSAQISLNPAELGPIEVKVNMQNDQASVNFFAHNAGVRDAIEEAFPRLREMLNENGVNLSQSSVSDQSLSEHREQGQLAGQEQDQYPYSEGNPAEDSAQESTTSLTVGLVDHFV